MPNTTDTPAPANAAPDAEMDSWAMATSCLVGLLKARAKAQEELDAVRAANPGALFAPGYGKPAMILEALSAAIASYEPELQQAARANNLPWPDLQSIRASGAK